MTKTRLKVLYYYLFNNSNGIKFIEFLKYFFAESYTSKTAKKIDKIESNSNWLIIYFKGFENKPLFYPRCLEFKSLEQVIVESFYKDNWHYYEIEQTKVIKNDIVVDCGAAEGLFSLVTSTKYNEIYLIEPLKEFVCGLKLTFSEDKNIHIIERAISDHEGKMFISKNGINSQVSDKDNGEEIVVTTLDKLFFENNIPVSYIKIDLEGFDYLALRGGKKLIEKYNPKIAVTTYHNIDHASQIKNFLLDINPNYKILTKGIYQETGSPIMLHAWV